MIEVDLTVGGRPLAEVFDEHERQLRELAEQVQRLTENRPTGSGVPGAQVVLSSAQVAAMLGKSPQTVRRRVEQQLLHGHQSAPGAEWTFLRSAVDAYIRGLDLRAQVEACGCTRHLRVVRRRAS